MNLKTTNNIWSAYLFKNINQTNMHHVDNHSNNTGNGAHNIWFFAFHFKIIK